MENSDRFENFKSHSSNNEMTTETHSIKYDPAITQCLDEMVKIANPCFIYGKYGRTTLLRECFTDIKIYDAREIFEVKNIGGFYAVKDNELSYVSGILIEAMRNGYKICFKNIDFNQNLLYYLRPVIYDRKIVAANGEEVTAQPSFRIFFTSSEELNIRNVAFIGPIEFTFESIFESFGVFRDEAQRIIRYCYTARSEKCPKDKGLHCEGICFKQDCFETNGYCLDGNLFRMLCEFRDTLFLLQSNSAGNEFRLNFYQAFINIFLKHESKQLSEFLMINVPALVLPNMLFAKTQPVESAIRSLMLNIRKRKPTLLVGETGAGKTALIQYLCENSEYFFGFKVSLKTVNMSSDFDGADLIGGFHSIDFDSKIRELYLNGGFEIPKTLDKKGILSYFIEHCSDSSLKNEAMMYLKILDKKLPFYFKEGILTESMKNGTWILLDEINLCSEETLNLIEAILSKDEMILFESGNFAPIKIHPSFRIFACMNPHGDFGKKKYESSVFNKVFFYDFSTQLKCIKAVVQSITRNLITEVDQISEFYFEFKKSLSRKEYSNIIEPLVSGRTLCRALNLILLNREDENAIYNAFNLLFFTQLDLSSRCQALSLFKKYFQRIPVNTCFSDMACINGFILTPKVRIHLSDVSLAIQANLPVLLQGDTSTGKTSLIFALASKHSRKVVRINNHNQTEASDYLGSYTSTKDGIRFKYGPLVSAMKQGHWIVLDELNLAPSDVLEVLNRLLDDNRELYIPETDERIVPHPNFRIFATQNINYSGRHGLAKSFRNRFVEIFFYEKEDTEVKEILEKSCGMPPSFIKYMMGIYSILKTERTLNSLMTLRDLFKWARRSPTGYCELCEIGLDILFERQRTDSDRKKIVDVFSTVFSDRFALEKKNFVDLYFNNTLDAVSIENLNNIVITKSYRRLINLMYKAWLNHEPILLIGETGIGKTRMCEIVASLFKIELKSINVHNGIESSDFIGHSFLDNGDVVWKNGPLVEAMINGNAFLIDEINLAEDSALERLNSVLEDRKTLFIPEINWDVQPHETFRIVATMNPSGDFGKKELSPALRSRFTEIYFKLDDNEIYEIFDRFLDSMSLFSPSQIFDKTFFKAKFRGLTNISVRKVEMICSHIQKINESANEGLSSIVKVKTSRMTREDVWNDCLGLLELHVDNNCLYTEDSNEFGVYPYFLRRSSPQTTYSFESATSRVNLQKIIRALCHNKGVLLQGEPGVGKTSMISHIGAALNIPVLRINLSEQTEMSDLTGSYIPMGNSIKFVESELVEYLRNGHWIILDEINLCTQSVIEGLNSVLDHRKSLNVDGKTIYIHPNARIFGTMNPQNRNNGRKQLPKSFIDRFIVITMGDYTKDDIGTILKSRYGPKYLFDERLTLRGNIKFNEIEKGFDPALESNTYEIVGVDEEKYKIRIGKVNLLSNYVPLDYAIPHSHVPSIDLLVRCLYKNIPVILKGTLGRNALLRFVGSIFSLNPVQIDCHKDTDICDLLGQYLKTEIGSESSSLFEWSDSLLIRSMRTRSLIIFNTPEYVEKCVFDRLNSLFEAERSVNVYEKGFDTFVKATPETKFILCCDNPQMLSPALIDRCVYIEIPAQYSYLDLYKIFSCDRRKDSEVNELSCKKLKKESSYNADIFTEYPTNQSFSENLFRSMTNTESIVPCDYLDLDMKKYLTLGIVPTYFDKFLPIHNTIIESQIDKLFYLQQEKFIPFNSSFLEFYKDVSSCAVALPVSYQDKIQCLSSNPTTASLIKSSFPKIKGLKTDSIREISHFNCQDVPATLFDLKMKFLTDLKSATLSEYNDILFFSQNIHKISQIKRIEVDIERFMELISETDPLNLVKTELMNEKIYKENEIKTKISHTAKSIYKYGKGDLSELINQMEAINIHYTSLICQIDKRLGRDYSKFRSLLKTMTFCDYVNDANLRMFLEDFSDLSDYYLVHLFNNKHSCTRCEYIDKNSLHSSKQCSLRLIRETADINSYSLNIERHHSFILEKCLKPEYSRILFEKFTNSKLPLDYSALVFEAIVFNELLPHLSLQNKPIYEFTEDEVDKCIQTIFPLKTKAQVIETRANQIILGQDCIPMLELQNAPDSLKCMSIFTTPESVINELQSIRLQNEQLINQPFAEHFPSNLLDLETFLKTLYKKETCLSFDRNYAYFQYFLFGDLSIPQLERYFLECNTYEFLDRIYFAEEYLRHTNYSNLNLYNATLLYKSFDIESMFRKKHSETKIKLYKNPGLYEQTIHEFVDRFLYIPVLTVMKISFDEPTCNHEACNVEDDSIPSSLIEHLGDSENTCEKWVKLSKSFVKDVVLSSIKETYTKDEVSSKFLNRPVEDYFSYPELCLAKVVNTIVSNMNSGKYDARTADAALGLCVIGMKYKLPSYLYFVFKFSNTFDEDENYEEGVGLKSGNGQENMQDESIDENDVDDDYDQDKKDDIDSEGVEMENEGEMHSVSGEKEGESGVDDESIKGESSENEEEMGAMDDSKDQIVDTEIIDIDEESDELNENVESNESNETVDQESENEDTVEESYTTEDSETGSNTDSKDEIEIPTQTNSYDWKDASLNKSQTCTSADNYDKKVEGGNIDDKSALKEGEDGEEFVDGEGEINREGISIDKTVSFNKISADCTKLTNLLRVILESNKNSKYKGDFKSGKKLNLRKIVPYIASDYRKDKIWMKKQKSDKKEYVLRIFIDNSKSMFDQELVDTVSAIYYKLETSFSLLNIPVQLFKFGNTVRPCTVEDLTFDEDNTFINWTDEFEDGINIILTDGVFQNVGYAKDNFLVVMIDRGNIRKMSKVSLIDNKVFIEKYLDLVSLRYCIVQNMEDLEKVFVDALAGIIEIYGQYRQ